MRAMVALDDATLLERYHATPGRTVHMLSGFRDVDRRTSYDVLVDAVSELPREARVLDLACGDGCLLGRLAARGFSRLSGIDRSAHELAAARTRLPAATALHESTADALPFAGGAFDAVVCHMALMLMDPVEPVVAAIARVLRPGGVLAAVINRHHPDRAFAEFSRALATVTRDAGLERLRLGAPELYTEAGLRARLAPPRFAAPIELRDFIVERCATPDELWPCFAATYDVFRLPVTAQAALERALRAAWRPLAGDGKLSATMGMRLVRVRAAGEAA